MELESSVFNIFLASSVKWPFYRLPPSNEIIHFELQMHFHFIVGSR